MSSQPGTLDQSVKVPPAHCGPHSTMWPASDDVGARREGRGDRPRAEVGVHRADVGGQRLAGEHVVGARGADLVDLRQQVIALDRRDL
jgi:hypothetical protein